MCLVPLLTLGIGGYVYVSDCYRADEQAAAAMVQDGAVGIETSGSVTWFIPEQPTAGLIFYPGGKVEHTAYAPLMRACAEQGIICALVKMPGNLAVLNADAADGLRQTHPEVTDWYIAGHSLGGAMDAKHAEDFSGLILLAAYSTKDLTQTPLRVLSVYGSEDGVMNRDSYEKDPSKSACRHDRDHYRRRLPRAVRLLRRAGRRRHTHNLGSRADQPNLRGDSCICCSRKSVLKLARAESMSPVSAPFRLFL